jgi:hypothetical protein
MTFDNSNGFYTAVRATADRLDSFGLHREASEIRDALTGATGGEILGALGSFLKEVASQANVPQSIRPEIQDEISAIDAAYDRISQPRPQARTKKTEASL